MLKDRIYLDNNATTDMCNVAIKTFNKWLNCPNPSTDSKFALPAKKAITDARAIISKHMDISQDEYTIIFTSGATESNVFALRSTVRAFKKFLMDKNISVTPHIIVSEIEHPSVELCVNDMIDKAEVDVTFIRPNSSGAINPKDIELAIKPGVTCLISVMYANNEIPVINNINAIGKIATTHNIPLHSDCVQLFGKTRINMNSDNISILTASAHKFYGPKGVGLFVISNKLLEGYKITAEISGHQQFHLRGGTENVAGIASMAAALVDTFKNRKEKNQKMRNLRNLMLKKLADVFTFVKYDDYLKNNIKLSPVFLISLGPNVTDSNSLFNTALISVVKTTGRQFCNIELKNCLDKYNVVVSVGSACNTNSPFASKVIKSIRTPKEVMRGIIRISLGDHNTESDINQFVESFIKCVRKQCYDIN